MINDRSFTSPNDPKQEKKHGDKKTCTDCVCKYKWKFLFFDFLQNWYAVDKFLQGAKRTRPATNYLIPNNGEHDEKT